MWRVSPRELVVEPSAMPMGVAGFRAIWSSMCGRVAISSAVVPTATVARFGQASVVSTLVLHVHRSSRSVRTAQAV